ncbi:tol-pal system protein YbgF [Luteimonas sp. RD2P54]|uniref:Cell division coordinator CpoB n=1 Tax=Luteimonas endophytica TaxID=3042023 RepID=A0ABT6J600_9GAMM|nr:tol-pal system protein YbgF [Luteimonas endophytica]MDH5822254.1 tol-pal system protein YbgF [Luteimonas endophytica]
MRRYIAPIVVAAALVAAAPVSAQRPSLADRVAVLEQQAAANRGNVDLLNQLSQLRSEVTTLRSMVEELQQQNEQLKNASRDQYLDIDGRLNRLESGAGSLPAAPGVDGDAGTALPPPPPSDTAPSIHGDPGLLAQTADERGAYETAFDALRSGNYAEAAELFQDFLQRYPSGSYAPNALYWLGESYYVTQNYELAQQQFQALIDRYPTHDKAPGALLKVGLSQYGQEQLDAAEATLASVIERFPGSDAARTADDRLRAIQLGRLR